MEMPAPSAKTRSKITLNPSRVSSGSLPILLLSRLALSNTIFVASLDAGKEWLLSEELRLGVFWVLIRVLALGGLAVLALEGLTQGISNRLDAKIEWSVLGIASLVLFVQQACLHTALYRVSTIRVVLFTHFASFWVDVLVRRDSMRKMLVLLAAFLLSFVSDMRFTLSNVRTVVPGYVVLVLHGLATTGLEQAQGILAPSLGSKAVRMASILGATMIALPFYIFKALVYESTETPAAPLFSFVALPALTYSLFFLIPRTKEIVGPAAVPSKYFSASYASTLIPALILGPLAFSQIPSWTDCTVAALLYYGAKPDDTQVPGPSKTPTIRLAKGYLKTVLSNAESRRIFYFLVLNLAYMLVQMLYGVWTNSLGLISDAIHMAFDCMAIAMGLFASVMATWPPNERFTYGYGRIETLSGFANGIFLILISIFIVFEAIQRIIDPPEMNTSQLLLVSTLGLAVNLFGMFAMGGHHHHGHSHSHGHGHSHTCESNSHGGHGHRHSPALHVSHSEHSHEYEHGHKRTHCGSPDVFHSPEICAGEHHHGHENHHTHDQAQGPLSLSLTPSSSLHAHKQEDNRLNVPHMNGTSVPASAPPTTTQFHSRSVSLHIPNVHNSSPPLDSPPATNGPPNPPHTARHTRTPSLLPVPGLGSPLTPGYKFGHDAHYEQHHDHSHGVHVPNLHDHSHSHGGDHEGHSHNMRGVFLHVMADTLGSVGVIISTLLIQFYGWTGFDPIASLFIAVLIVVSVVPLVIDSGKVLCLDVSEREESIQLALAELPAIDGLAGYSAPRFWPKDSSSLIGSIRVKVERSSSLFDSPEKPKWVPVDRVVERVDSILRNRISGLGELTIQVEGSPNY